MLKRDPLFCHPKKYLCQNQSKMPNSLFQALCLKEVQMFEYWNLPKLSLFFKILHKRNFVPMNSTRMWLYKIPFMSGNRKITPSCSFFRYSTDAVWPSAFASSGTCNLFFFYIFRIPLTSIFARDHRFYYCLGAATWPSLFGTPS